MSSEEPSTPEGVRPIPNIEETIKEKHKNSRKGNSRITKACYDILSYELAYNLDYVEDFFQNQLGIHFSKKTISSSFLKEGPTVTDRMIAVKNLVKIAASRKCPSYILHQAVKLFDGFLDAKRVEVEDLQVISLASLWIAIKNNDTENLNATEILELAGENTRANKRTLGNYEKEMLMELNFDLFYADPFSMLALYAAKIKDSEDLDLEVMSEIYYFGSYMLDITLLDAEMCHVSSVHLATIAAEASAFLVTTDEPKLMHPKWMYWRELISSDNESLQKYRLSDAEMDHIRKNLLDKTLLSHRKDSDYHVIYLKNANKRYNSISKKIVAKLTVMMKLSIFGNICLGAKKDALGDKVLLNDSNCV